MRIRIGRLTSLRGRFLAVAGSFFVVSSLALTSFHFHQVRSTLHDEMEKRGHSTARNLVFQTARALERQDVAALREEVAAICADGDVRYVMVQDRDGQVIAEASRDQVDLPGVRAALISNSWLPGVPEMLRVRTSNGKVYHNFSAPVWREADGPVDPGPAFAPGAVKGGRRLATVRVGFTTEAVMGRIEKAFGLSLAFLLAIVAAGLTGIILVARWALKPLDRMAGAARSIAAGDLSQRVEVTTSDEIGALGNAFNEMTSSLALSREALDSRNAELERAIGEREKSLLELRETQERLAHSESTRHTEKLRTVGQMASGVAHDFNNILAVITGRVQLLKIKASRNRISTADVLASLEIIERASLDGADTVRRIQEFSRDRHGKEMQRGDLNHMVREVVEITRPRWKDQVEQGGARVEVVMKLGRVPQIACIPSEIREVLTNLVFNAVDAMPDGGMITLKTEAEPEGVLLTVTDTGTGMPPEVMERIFEPFFTTKGVKGNGLGLSIVYGIIQRHGGEITVGKGPGKGTQFQIRLPAADEALPEVVAESMMTNRPARILVGDDEVNVRQALVEILISLGHEVEEAGCGREILEKHGPGRFDLVFTDLGMPDLGGYDVARLIRERDPGVPIILVTGWGNQIRGEEAQARCITRVLAKPFTIQKVSSVIAEVQGLQLV